MLRVWLKHAPAALDAAPRVSTTVSLSVGSGWRTAVSADGEEGRVDPRTGSLHIETDDGGLLIKRDWTRATRGTDQATTTIWRLAWGQGALLATLGDDLLRGIEAGRSQSRREYLETVSRTAIKMPWG